MLVALIGCVTVFQCHHHDMAGHAFFLVSGDNEVIPGLGHGDCQADGDGARHDGNTADCGLHVDVAPLIEKDAVRECVYPDFVFIADALIPSSDVSQPISVLLWRNDVPAVVTDGHIRTGLLRGPPCV